MSKGLPLRLNQPSCQYLLKLSQQNGRFVKYNLYVDNDVSLNEFYILMYYAVFAFDDA